MSFYTKYMPCSVIKIKETPRKKLFHFLQIYKNVLCALMSIISIMFNFTSSMHRIVSSLFAPFAPEPVILCASEPLRPAVRIAGQRGNHTIDHIIFMLAFCMLKNNNHRHSILTHSHTHTTAQYAHSKYTAWCRLEIRSRSLIQRSVCCMPAHKQPIKMDLHLIIGRAYTHIERSTREPRRGCCSHQLMNWEHMLARQTAKMCVCERSSTLFDCNNNVLKYSR